MKSLLTFLVLMLAGTVLAYGQSGKQKKVLRHIVLVKFKESSSDDDIKKIIADFARLPEAIDQLKAFEWGLNNSPENLNEGLTHAFVLSFSSEKGRDEYLVHPAHEAFVGKAGPHIDKVVVVDYWMK